MRIGITGHTAGLGKQLYDLLSVSYEVHGFSLENGYDIGLEDSVDQIVNAVKDFDCFINNAYHATGQQNLLEKIYHSWHDTNKIIINLGSWIVTLSPEQVPDIHQDYYQKKSKQLEFSRSKISKWNPQLIHLLPGTIDTKSTEDIEDYNKMDPKTVAELVADMLKYSNMGIYVQELYFTATI